MKANWGGKKNKDERGSFLVMLCSFVAKRWKSYYSAKNDIVNFFFFFLWRLKVAGRGIEKSLTGEKETVNHSMGGKNIWFKDCKKKKKKC